MCGPKEKFMSFDLQIKKQIIYEERRPAKHTHKLRVMFPTQQLIVSVFLFFYLLIVRHTLWGSGELWKQVLAHI